MANPELAAGFSNPKVQAAIIDISANPMNIMKYQSEPEVMRVLEQVGPCPVLAYTDLWRAAKENSQGMGWWEQVGRVLRGRHPHKLGYASCLSLQVTTLFQGDIPPGMRK